MLIKRRDKIASVYLTAVNPIVAPRLDANSRLTFENAAVAAGVASGPVTYRASWLLLRQRDRRDAGRFRKRRARRQRIEAPSGLPTASGSFVEVDISADSAAYPTWRRPIRTLFPPSGRRLDARGARTVAREPPDRSSGAASDALTARASPGRRDRSLDIVPGMPERSGRSRGDVVAVIDIGSNSGRVMVFERDTSSHLRLLAGSRASLRLVHDVDARGALSDATMARTTEALRDFQAIANGAGATRIVAVATAAMRDATTARCSLNGCSASWGFESR